MSASEGIVPHRVVRLSPGSAVATVAAVATVWLGVGVFVAAHRPLSWAAAAVVAAVVLDPMVDRLAVHIRRVPAVFVCFLVAGTAVVGTAYLVFDDVDRAVERLQDAAPAAAARIEERDDRVGQLARDFSLGERIADATERLGERVGRGGGEVLRSTAVTAPAYLVGAILTVFLMSYGPRISRSALEQLPVARQDGVNTVLVRAADRARHATLLVVADCVVVGALVAGAALALDLPAPAALGLSAALFAVLPHLGILLGSVPLLLLTLGLESTWAAGAVLLGVLGLQAFDSLVVRRRIDRSVRIGLLAPFVVVLLAHDVYGVGGAVYGLAYAVFGMAVLDELAVDDAPSDGDTPGALARDTAPT